MNSTNFNFGFSSNLSYNCIKNLNARELGLLKPNLFINFTNTKYLDELHLSKYKSISSLNHSVNYLNQLNFLKLSFKICYIKVTWLSLDPIENRL